MNIACRISFCLTITCLQSVLELINELLHFMTWLQSTFSSNPSVWQRSPCSFALHKTIVQIKLVLTSTIFESRKILLLNGRTEQNSPHKIITPSGVMAHMYGLLSLSSTCWLIWVSHVVLEGCWFRPLVVFLFFAGGSGITFVRRSPTLRVKYSLPSYRHISILIGSNSITWASRKHPFSSW